LSHMRKLKKRWVKSKRWTRRHGKEGRAKCKSVILWPSGKKIHKNIQVILHVHFEEM
jgi:hypothetical protein